MNFAALEPRSRYITCEEREIHFMDWVPAQAGGPVVVAWHGLARTGRDMDPLAAHLCAQGWRVICPDTIGRGLSQWSPDPKAEYCLDFYSKLAKSLVDQLALDRFHWVGTSMGGAIGMVCAAGSLRGRIERLVLNDIGPQLAPAAVQRIRSYAGSPSAFNTMRELEQYFREVYKPYGHLPDKQWRLLTESSMRRLPDGRVTPHYDTAMVQQFEHHPDDYELWSVFDSIDVPVLCLRGADSDLLLVETAEAMRDRGPRALVVTIPGCGHAPALNVPDQLELVQRFLAGH
ncbi:MULTISPECIES: alpha/beta fold hydrolase [Hydrogenophaga]|uniref:Alpha/beta hydrolase fold protein n=1 Tax=Hydrogenophaga intermedia TaxID=65786 RepID=A0A1L1PG19_HYDIT|nr:MULTISPECIES: alpha/beta hydrolase [Hydrogenophaga]AOS78814.1 hydrolase [Hydrogenophaga sp. PBC]TMU71325.1 alpha/beta hydrolase [Hydrogenophaga intermedia]CDN88898.1 Alpha/beta hydrolase fold protein [Hydrogenophaga intermedia]